MTNFTKTKIVATIGPSSNSKEMLLALIGAGVNVFRLNFSHGTHEEHEKVINLIHEINDEIQGNIGILADLQGPKIRLGLVENNSVELKKGDIIELTTEKCVSTAQCLYITYSEIAMDVKSGDKILIDDGKIELRVTATNGIDKLTAKVIYGGLVSSKKGVNLPNTNVSSPALTPKDINDLKFILEHHVNWIALSFVRTADEILRLKGMIDYKQHAARVIAKIEKPQALKNIDAIIHAADAIMVARGDLGVEMPLEQIPTIQKELVKKCVSAAKPVIIATQMMESMIENASPTRAEVTDIATAIFNGADALMLSGETAVGKHPVKVISTMKKVIKTIEKEDDIYNVGQVPNQKSNTFVSDVVCYTACRLAENVGAKGIIGMTKSGYTAFLLSSFRPKANIFIFTESIELLKTVSLVWGVRAFHYTKFVSTDDTISDVQQILTNSELIKQDDFVVNTGSMPLHERGRTNTIKVSHIN